MKISVVTISYNQCQFLNHCLDSIAAQEGPWEHIIVDPGSSDGSREIIERRCNHFSHIIFEPDHGPADGLNKGFAKASGEIYFYLNSDDIVLPDAFSEARKILKIHRYVDVIAGGCYIIDRYGKRKRTVWSDNVSKLGLALGGCILIQPSTFFRSEVFVGVGGFNASNMGCWDAELIRDMYRHGAYIESVPNIWSGYRIYANSITESGRFNNEIQEYNKETYLLLMGHRFNWVSFINKQMFRLKRIIQNRFANS